MNGLFAALVALASLFLRSASAPTAGDCRMQVWLTSEVPIVYGHRCVGSCTGGYSCTEKKLTIFPKTYFYCKCLLDGLPPNPDSTACTTVVTFNEVTHTWDHYCVNQACATSCPPGQVTWTPSTPCLCQ